MIKNLLEKIAAREDLSILESENLMDKIMTGNFSDVQIAAVISALKVKGETSAEIAGFALSMRNHCRRIDIEDPDLIDVCGTGGDNSGTFNISTASAFVIAGAGVKVAKHGNRSISSLSGSADVLSELGINISMKEDEIKKAIDRIGLIFLFAPNFHPAMKYASKARSEMKVKTIFNILGPLCNPAFTKKQLIGTYNNAVAEKMAGASKHLDMERICFVNTLDKFDEILLNGPTTVHEFTKGERVKTYQIDHKTFGLNRTHINQLKGSSPKENAGIIYKILSNNYNSDAMNVVLGNSAMGLNVSGYSTDLKECLQAARDSLAGGFAGNILKKLREI